MSLYTFEEICVGCDFAVWHGCCQRFCYCRKEHGDDTNNREGTCPYKRVRGEVVEKEVEE